MYRQLSRLAAAVVAAAVLVLAAGPARADELTALARVLPDKSELRDSGRGIALDLGLSQPVPWRVRTLDGPPRLLLDFREVDFSTLAEGALGQSRRVAAMRFGTLRPGWSRMVLELDGPYAVTSAAMQTGGDAGQAVVRLRLAPTGAEDFAAAASPPDALDWDLPDRATRPRAAQPRAAASARGEEPLVVVLDPGHGGIDPGAQRDGLRESDLMLSFARELKEALLRAGGFEVVLTRDADIFVSLEGRVRISRQAGADVFLSLHADALADGAASGATVYTLAEEANDAASTALAERHDRADLLAGVDLSAQDDLVANVLMSIARTETAPRTDRLAEELERSLRDTIGRMHRRPRQAAGFSVLKAPDIPSVLLELGFISSDRDLANLQNPEWRANAVGGIVLALQRWALADAAEAALRRR
jgi:N-acetylmuramoyl-L-alanine amidase